VPYVHAFEDGVVDVARVGGKGASLARMFALGLPTPPGFTIAADAWRAYRAAGDAMPAEVRAELAEHVDRLERALGRRFGGDDPLMVSVRSGAPVSMPGMMDTILNLGLGDAGVAALEQRGEGPLAWALYERLLATFAEVVNGVPAADVEAARASGEPRAAAAALLELIERAPGPPFPQDPRAQLEQAVEAVWRSWDSRRARRYRRHAGIDESLGTAVTVQTMVFGNRDRLSGTGVVFTRDPATGAPGAYGDFLAGAQGEDVVDGSRDTEPLEALAALAPAAMDDLAEALPRLERAYRDMCDVEFTVESGRLWILQARVGARGGAAAVRIAVDMVDEGLIEIEEAIERVPLAALEQLQAPVLAAGQELDVLGAGTPAAPGTAVGVAAFDSGHAEELAAGGADVVLLRPETSPEDIAGMIAARGIVTAVGGRTSHAAVVARGLGRPAVCGVAGLEFEAGEARLGGRAVRAGDALAVDGDRGLVACGDGVVLAEPEPDRRVARLLDWCDARRRVPIEPASPDAVAVLREPDDARPGLATAVVEVEWEGASSAALLERTVAAALAADVGSLRFALPETLRDGDLRLPAGPWEAIVAAPGWWPARLLAARVALA
jgi:pyruvate,orthophosphate dikinase